MVDELILHLGDRKTGSTSIQTALASQAATSSAGSIVYPTRWNHNPLANAIRGEADPGFLEKRAELVRRRFLKSQARFGILSAEHFEVTPPEAVQQFLLTYLPEWQGRTRLVSYIRPHADRLLSSFAERAKLGGRNKDIRELYENFKANRFLEYAPRLRGWRSVFGDSLVVRPFRRDLLINQDVVADFFNIVFRGAEATLKPVASRNESISIEDLAMLKWVHKTIRNRYGSKIKKTTIQAFGRRLAIVLASSGGSGRKLQMDRELVEEVISTYRDDAMAVDREWFDGQPMLEGLESHRQKAVENEQSLAASDYFDEQTLRLFECWAEFTGRMMTKNQKQFLTLSLPPELRPRPTRN